MTTCIEASTMRANQPTDAGWFRTGMSDTSAPRVPTQKTMRRACGHPRASDASSAKTTAATRGRSRTTNHGTGSGSVAALDRDGERHPEQPADQVDDQADQPRPATGHGGGVEQLAHGRVRRGGRADRGLRRQPRGGHGAILPMRGPLAVIEADFRAIARHLLPKLPTSSIMVLLAGNYRRYRP